MTHSIAEAFQDWPRPGYVWLEKPGEYRPSSPEGERWRFIPGWENIYMVSSNGEISSQPRVVIGRNGRCRQTSARRLRPGKTKSGYFVVNLSNGARKESHPVHRLVARAFLENPGSLPFVNHIDGDRANNKLANLEWIDGVGNALHARNSQPSRSGLTFSDVREIKAYRRRAITKLATHFKVAEATIRDIFAGRTWDDLPDCEVSQTDSSACETCGSIKDAASHVCQN